VGCEGAAPGGGKSTVWSWWGVFFFFFFKIGRAYGPPGWGWPGGWCPVGGCESVGSRTYPRFFSSYITVCRVPCAPSCRPLIYITCMIQWLASSWRSRRALREPDREGLPDILSWGTRAAERAVGDRRRPPPTGILKMNMSTHLAAITRSVCMVCPLRRRFATGHHPCVVFVFLCLFPRVSSYYWGRVLRGESRERKAVWCGSFPFLIGCSFFSCWGRTEGRFGAERELARPFLLCPNGGRSEPITVLVYFLF